MRRTRRLVTITALAASALFAAAAHGQPETPGDQARAIGLEAKQLFAKGDMKSAYARFDEAERIAHSPVFLLYMARCKRGLSEWIAARELLRKLAKEPVGTDAPEQWTRAQEEAAAELRDLEAQMPEVVISVRGAATGSYRLAIDEVVAAPGAVTELDPGRHVASVDRSGAPRFDRSFEVDERSRPYVLEIDLPALVTPLPPATVSPAPPRTSRPGSLLPGMIGVGLGVGGLAAGTVLGVAAKSKASDAIANCDATKRCPEADGAKATAAKSLATASTIGFIAGGTLAAAGVVLLIVRPGGGSEATLAVAPGPAAVRIAGTF